MRRLLAFAGAVTSLLLLSAPVFAQNEKPDATLELTQVSAAIFFGYTWGGGTLTFEDKAYPVDIDAFGKSAETISQYMKKGSPILVEGRLRLHTWEDKQTNQKQSKLRVDLETFKCVGPAQGREGGAPEAPRTRPATMPVANASATAGAGEPAAEEPPSEDDVPF